MKYIINYRKSDSCERALNSVWDKLDIEKSSIIKFNINETDFKCNNVILKYNIVKSKENLCNVETLLKDSEMEEGYLSNVIINLRIEYYNLSDEFIYYIKSVLLHELLHVFQHYNILLGNKFRPESYSIGSIIPQIRNIVRTEYGKYILDILYFSLSHELSAQLHQYYLYKINNMNYKRIYDIINNLSNFKIDNLTNDEEAEVKFIKNHIYKSILYYTNNNNYLNDVNKSLWVESDVYLFLDKLKAIILSKVKWINKKIKLIDSKIEDSKNIKYDENITLPHNWEMYDRYKINDFIFENLSDINNIHYI